MQKYELCSLVQREEDVGSGKGQNSSLETWALVPVSTARPSVGTWQGMMLPPPIPLPQLFKQSYEIGS